MAGLPIQTIPIPLTGLNQGVDEKNAPVGTLDLIENMYREQDGELVMRSGTSNFSSTTDSGTISDAVLLGQLGTQPVLLTGDALYHRAPGLSKWSNRGSVRTLLQSAFTVNGSGYRQTGQDVCYLGGMLFFAWEELSNVDPALQPNYSKIYYSVIDATTGGIIVAPTRVVGSAETDTYFQPKLAAVGSSVIIFYQEINGAQTSIDLKAKKVTTSAPQTLSSAAQVTQLQNGAGFTAESCKPYDVMTVSTKVAVVGHTVSGNMGALYWAEGMTVDTALVDQGITTNANACAFLDHDASDSRLWVANGVELIEINSTTLARVAGSSNSTTLRQCTGYVSSGVKTILYDVKGSNAYDTITYKRVDGAAATIVSRSVGIGSHAFKVNGVYYVNLIYDSTSSGLVNSNQSVTLTWNISSGKVAGKPFPGGISMGLPFRKGCLSRGAVISSSRTVVGALQRVGTSMFATAIGGTPAASAYGNAVGLNVELPDYRLSQPVNAAGVLVIPGAQPRIYDGKECTEIGFHYAPEKPVCAVASSTAGEIDQDTYTYKAIYRRYYLSGRLERSAPSAASASATVSAGGKRVEVTVSTMRVTDKSNVQVDIYREEGDGIYYLVGTIANDTSADTVVFYDQMTRAVSQTQETLYTYGDPPVLEDLAPPACTCVGVAGNRVWLGGVITGEIWHSKEIAPDFGLAFNDFLTMPNQDGETPTAIVEMDEKPIIAYANMVCNITGTGPNALGIGDYEQHKAVVGSGTIRPRVFCATPLGVVAFTKDGWRLLSRGLSMEPLGGPVQDYDSNSYTGSVVLPKRSHAMLFTSDGRTLVWDYARNQWYTYVTQAASAASNYGDVYAYVKSDGTVVYEVDGQTNDNSAAITEKFRITWLNFAGVTGFQRIYAIQALGEYVGAHGLRATWEFNFDTATTYVYNVTPSANPYRFETRPPIQECTSARVTIQGVMNTATGGFKLSSLAALVGVEPAGQRPVASSARLT